MRLTALGYWFADLIDHEAEAAGPPPQRLTGFMHWCLAGSYRVIGIGALAYASVALSEIAVMVMLGWIVDAAISSGRPIRCNGANSTTRSRNVAAPGIGSGMDVSTSAGGGGIEPHMSTRRTKAPRRVADDDETCE